MKTQTVCRGEEVEELFGEDFYCEEDELVGELDSI